MQDLGNDDDEDEADPAVFSESEEEYENVAKDIL